MRLTESHLQAQIARLKTLPRREDREWGSGKKEKGNYEPGLRDELFAMLWTQASSDEHATRITNRVIEACKFCPAPAEIAEIAASVPADLEASQEYQLPVDPQDHWTKACPLCHTSGMVKNGARWERCTCVDGRDLPQNLLDMQNAWEERNAQPKVVEPGPGSMKSITQRDIDAARLALRAK